MRLSYSTQKPENSFGDQREGWRRAYAEAPSVRERFPNVERLVIDLSFVDLKGIGRYSPQMRSLSAPAKAFFAFACPRTLCLQGGFDLDPIISSMLRASRTESIGVLECRGWVHPQRTENLRCRLQMHYRLEAVYELAKPGSSRRGARA